MNYSTKKGNIAIEKHKIIMYILTRIVFIVLVLILAKKTQFSFKNSNISFLFVLKNKYLLDFDLVFTGKEFKMNN